jgi:hypothetical protein
MCHGGAIGILHVRYHRFRDVRGRARCINKRARARARALLGVVRARDLSRTTSYLSGEEVMYLERDARHKAGKPVISR